MNNIDIKTRLLINLFIITYVEEVEKVEKVETLKKLKR